MNKLIVAGVTIAALLTGPAVAADMPLPAPVAVESWTGFYVGGSIGGRFTDANWTTTCLNAGTPGGLGCPVNVAQHGVRFPFSNPSGFNAATLRPSVYFGYNWQIGNWVVGVEGDAASGKARSDMKGIPGAEVVGLANAVLQSPGFDSATVETTWDASARARAGFLLRPNLLLYATGGTSWIHAEASAYCGRARPTGWCAGPAGAGSNLNTESKASETRIGWTAGVGAEALMWSNWLMRLEYRFANYGTFGYTLFSGAGACGAGCDAITAATTLHTHTVLAGFAYKFGGALFAP